MDLTQDILNGFEDVVKDELKKIHQQQNEAILSTAALALAVPGIAKAIIRLIEGFKKKYNFSLSKNSDSKSWLKIIEEIADKIDNKLNTPFNIILKPFIQDEVNRKKIAGILKGIFLLALSVGSDLSTAPTLYAKIQTLLQGTGIDVTQNVVATNAEKIGELLKKAINYISLKEQVKSLIRKQLEEMSTAAGVGGYSTPFAFAPNPNKAPKNAATKQAQRSGWKLADGMPKNSKVLDYKELWKGKKSAMNENMSAEDALKQIKPLLAHTIKHDKLSGSFEELLAKVKAGDDKILDKMWDLTGSAIDRYAINVLSKPKTMNESLIDIIEKELLNEVTYSKFKNDVKFRTKNEQLHKAIREVKRKLSEIDRIVEYTSRMKQELSEGEEGVKYWKATQKNVATISEMVNQLNNKIKNLQQ